MSKAATPRPSPELEEFLSLVKTGRLFELQAWSRLGRKIPHSDHPPKHCPLCKAVEAGFHSMVDFLLGLGNWTQPELDAALNQAIEARRTDLAELLQDHGAAATSIDFEMLCRTAQPELIERFLRAGADPSRDNAFARALSEIKARPLLRFYRSLKDEFPALHAQASLALAHAVSEKQVRWVALLAWAGADPFMNVPFDLYSDWNLSDDDTWTAAHSACFSGNYELMKVLKLKPTPEQALDLLESAVWHPSVDVVKELLRKTPAIDLNKGDPPSCAAVERLIDTAVLSPIPGYHTGRGTIEAATCLGLLLDAGARWQPEQSRIKSIRRALLTHSSDYIIRVLRLLIHTPGAADKKALLELCNSPVLRGKISHDRPLLKDIEALRLQAGQRCR